MRNVFLILVAALPLYACSGGVRPAERASFDLGGAAVVWQTDAVPLAAIQVAAPSWLATSAMQYRLLYAEPLQRRTYAESRWAAPPAELIERALNRQPAANAAGCRLRLDLDEWVQAFDGPAQSRVLLELRATLLPPHGDAVLTRKAFAVVEPAPTADARGGAAAAAAAARSAAGELGRWLAEVGREAPLLAERCKGVSAGAR